MPSDRAAFFRFLAALAVLSVASAVLFCAASHDHRHVVVVRATPTPALAQIAARP